MALSAYLPKFPTIQVTLLQQPRVTEYHHKIHMSPESKRNRFSPGLYLYMSMNVLVKFANFLPGRSLATGGWEAIEGTAGCREPC